jgi:hypothetical protein
MRLMALSGLADEVVEITGVMPAADCACTLMVRLPMEIAMGSLSPLDGKDADRAAGLCDCALIAFAG